MPVAVEPVDVLDFDVLRLLVVVAAAVLVDAADRVDVRVLLVDGDVLSPFEGK